MPIVVVEPGLRERAAVHGHRDEGRDGGREERAVQAEALAAPGRHQVVRFDVARIERELAVLVGLPLWGAARAADLLTLAFGAERHGVSKFGRRKGEPRTYGEYALHVQCTWRIAGPDGIVTGRPDRFYPHSDLLREREDWKWWDDPDWDSLQLNANRWDERIEPWLAAGPYVVERVAADPLGGLSVALAGGFALDVFPDSSDDTEYSEYWRFFKPDDPRPHFVVLTGGIDC